MEKVSRFSMCSQHNWKPLLPVAFSHLQHIRMQSMKVQRPFTAAVSGQRPSVAHVRPCRAAETRVVRVRAAEESVEQPAAMEFMDEERGPRRSQQDQPQFKHFLPLPKPNHLIYIKPTVAVVAGMAQRSSVGLKMTAGDNALERYVIEFYSKSVK